MLRVSTMVEGCQRRHRGVAPAWPYLHSKRNDNGCADMAAYRHNCCSCAVGLGGASGMARAMSAAVMSPVTLVKTRMEYGGPNHISYKNTAHALATIARTEGPSGLFRGLWPTVLTNAPFSALYYMIYTKLKVALSTWQSSSSSDGGGWNSTAVNFVSGVCAATAATLLTQPSDVVRTRMQLGLPGTVKGNAIGTLGHLLRSSGPNALLTGKHTYTHLKHPD